MCSLAKDVRDALIVVTVVSAAVLAMLAISDAIDAEINEPHRKATCDVE